MSAWNSANGLRNVNAYDDDMRLIGIRVPNIQSWDYGYDTANRITTVTDNLDGTLTQTLGYDELNRLTSLSSTADNESYTYDSDGNRLTAQINGTAWTYTPDASNNRLDSFAPQGVVATDLYYDQQGNLTCYGGSLAAGMSSTDGDLPPRSCVGYHYNPFNRMDSTTYAGAVTNIDISPEGQRLRKYTSTNSTWFAPDPNGTLMAEDQDGTWADYVWLNGKLVAMIRNGNVYSVHTDQTGRPEGMTNSQGTVVWRAHNYAFDREVTAGQASGFNLGFPGQYFDQEDGLYYNGYRDYDPTLGRYIESDPMGLLGGVNTYAYVGDNPITGIDPLGLCQSKKCGTPPALPPGVSVKTNIQYVQTLRGLDTSLGMSDAAQLVQFYNLVNYGAPMDYKTQDTFPGQYDAGGNFNYGAVGAAAGYSTQLLLRAAGAAQIMHGSSSFAWAFPLGPFGGPPYGDQPIDQAQIKAGIGYYQCVESGGQ